MAVYDGGGGGGTNWSVKRVDDMWAILQNHDSAPHLQMASAWQRSYQLILTHLSQVKQFRDNLAAAWPPGKSEAASAYVAELDGLILSLEETYDAAIANHRALSTAVAAIDSTKAKLEAIQREYSANDTLLRQYIAEISNRPVTTATAWAPAPKLPVADGRQAELQKQASSLMESLSVELASAQTSFVAPKPYKPLPGFGDSGEAFDPGGTTINMPAMTPTFSPRSLNSARAPKSTMPTSGTRENLPSPNNRSADPSPSNRAVDLPGLPRTPAEGPILGGAKPQPAPPTPGVPPAPQPPITAFPPNIEHLSPHNFTPTTSTSPSVTPPRLPTPNSTSVNTLPPTAGTNGTRGNPLPHGGVIGGNPPVGVPASGRPSPLGASTRGAQKVNPVGGLIGQGALGQPGQRRVTRNDEEARSQRWDPDNPWETRSGMDPVLLPAQEQRIDPGPTIGGR